MNQTDKSAFFESVNKVLEVYGKPPITHGAAQHWWDALKEFDHNDVFAAINYWPTYNAKPPLPADVWRHLNEKRAEKIERDAEEMRKVARPERHHVTPEGRRLAAELKAFLSKPVRRKPWWQLALERAARGENVPHISLKWAKEVAEAEK